MKRIMALSISILVLILCLYMINPTVFIATNRVIDGDTFVTTGGKHIRLYGIDAPEVGEYGCERATRFTRDFLEKSFYVEMRQMDIDKYGRTVAIIRRDGKTLNEQLVRYGHAKIVWEYCTDSTCKDWAKYQRKR